MRVKQVSTPALPITLASVKDHLRIEQADVSYDADLTSLIRTAQEWIYSTCHLTLTNTIYEAYFDSFPCGKDPIKIPGYPVQEIQTLGYTDLDEGTTFIFGFQEDFIQVPSKLYPAPGEEWPTDVLPEKINAIKVTFLAGFGASATNVPDLPKHLIKLLVAHWFKNREAVITGTISKEIEIAADNLMKLMRVNEFEAFT